MKIGNVIIADGKVGVLTHYSDQLNFDSSPYIRLRGVYLDGVDFSVSPEKSILLDECLNDYINRHVAKFGKLKICNKGEKNERKIV